MSIHGVPRAVAMGIPPRVRAMNNIAGLALPNLRNEKTLQTRCSIVGHAQPIAYPTVRVAATCVCAASLPLGTRAAPGGK
jgi:hypothetical protein